MAQTLFISDLHLSEDTPAIEAGLYAFLERERSAAALYILGDFFEAWVGDDDDAPLVQRVKAALKQYSANGPSLYLMRGNRDFMLGETFAEAVDATLLGDTECLVLDGVDTLILHGDTLCTDDADYQQFRAMVHNAAWQSEMMSKPLAERRALARQLRTMSTDAASNKPEDIMDVNDDAVARALIETQCQRLIHGHTHRPGRHNTAEGERVVLGDWGTTGWCVRLDDGVLSLEQFPLT